MYVCLMILWSGLSLSNMSESTTSGSSAKMKQVRCRVTTSSLGLGLCLFIEASLWVAAVQATILNSFSATVDISIAFHVADWLSLCMLTALFAVGVRHAVGVQIKREKL